MRLVDILKEKRPRFQIGNSDFIKRIEPQVREFTASLNQTVANSIANSRLAKLMSTTSEDKPSAIPANGLAAPSIRLVTPSNTRQVVLNSQLMALQQKLSLQLGCEIHVGDWFHLNQQCIDDFSRVTGDKQWIHVDVERAQQESPFHSTVAHGFLILSLLPRLCELEDYATLHYPEARLVVNNGANNIQFLAPVKPGSSIRARTRLIDVTVNKRSLDIVQEVVVEIKNSTRRACLAELIIRLYI